MDDLVNFQWDPVTAAVAARWQGASTEGIRLEPLIEAGTLHWRRSSAGRFTSVVVDLDGDDFDEGFLAAVEAAQR